MHENGTSVWACHFGASKTYGGGEHVNANTILHMKVINELEHGHKPCGIQARDIYYGKDFGNYCNITSFQNHILIFYFIVAFGLTYQLAKFAET